MVTLVNLYATDLMHLEINTFFVNIYRSILGEEVHLFADQKHLDAIQSFAPVEEGYSFNSWAATLSWRMLRVPLREFITIFRVIRVALHARRYRATLLHILCASHLSHVTLRLVLRLICPGCPVLLSFHGELESLASQERRPWRAGFWFPLSLSISVEHLYPVVLGKNIEVEAERRHIRVTDWIAIDHPYSFTPIVNTIKRESRFFVAGVIGGANLTKGTNLVFDLAKRFKGDIDSGEMRFRIIGKMDPSLIGYVTDDVEIPRFRGFYDRARYEAEVAELDVVLFFFPKGSYEFTPSGSIFDAIKHNKPIIAYDNKYFKWIKRLSPGEAISLVSNMDEFESVLRRWSVYGPPRSTEADYEAIKQHHSNTTVAVDFLEQLEKKVHGSSHLRSSNSSNGQKGV